LLALCCSCAIIAALIALAITNEECRSRERLVRWGTGLAGICIILITCDLALAGAYETHNRLDNQLAPRKVMALKS